MIEPTHPTNPPVPVDAGAVTTHAPPPAKKTERPHPLTPLIRGWVVLIAVVFTFGRQLIPDGSGDNGLPPVTWLVIGIVAVCVLAIVAGLFAWWFTRFVIDDDELRIDTGAIFRSSKRIAYERIQTVDLLQPMAARIFGLAELKIDVGSGENQTRLRYLTRADATRMRDYLVARAHGEQADRTRTSSADAFADRSATDRTIAQVSPTRLVGAFFLSTELISSVVFVAVGYAVTAFFGVTLYALPALLPFAIGIVTMLSRSVLSQFNYTLAESGRGLRVTRGLTNLSSQSIPIDRVQGLRITQPILWRQVGWYRIDVDVLGIKTSNDNENNGSSTSILQPVATAEQVSAVLGLIMPGVDLDGVELHRSPRRSAWLRPFDFWTMRYGWSKDVIVGQIGWLIRTREVVPHEKTQSVRIEQGPIQRRLRLASVAVHTTPGPVNMVARHLDAPVARELAMTQLDRARTARQRVVARRAAVAGDRELRPGGSAEPALLGRFGIDPSSLLGAGSESRVFALPDGRHVLRVSYPADQPDADQPDAENEHGPAVERRLRDLLTGFQTRPVGLQTPVIVDSGDTTESGVTQHWRVDQRMHGSDLSSILRGTGSTTDRRAILLTYLEAAMTVWRLPVPIQQWARLIHRPAAFGSLQALLGYQLDASSHHHELLAQRVPDLAAQLDRLRAELAERQCAPTLVHGDFCPPNVFAAPDRTGAVRITGVGDFSAHTLVADPVMDVAGRGRLPRARDLPRRGIRRPLARRDRRRPARGRLPVDRGLPALLRRLLRDGPRDHRLVQPAVPALISWTTIRRTAQASRPSVCSIDRPLLRSACISLINHGALESVGSNCSVTLVEASSTGSSR